MNTSNILKALGISGISDSFIGTLDTYREWYEGNVSGFHDYNIFNGTKSIPRRRTGLAMAKTVSESFADLLLNERVEFTIDGKNKEEIEKVLEESMFKVRGNQLVELAFATGTGAFVLSLENVKVSKSGVVDQSEGNVVIRYLEARDIFPLSWDNGVMSEVAFRSTVSDIHVEEGKEFNLFTLIQEWEEDGEKVGYSITNRLFDDDGNEVEEEIFDELLPDTIKVLRLKVDKAPFAIIKPNTINFIDPNSPYGLPVFAGSLDVLREIDTVWDSLINEYNLGKKRIFIDEKAMSYDKSGNPKFDNNDVVFYTLGGLMGDGESAVGSSMKETDFKLRVEEHVQGLKAGLNTLSQKCGLGSNYYSFDVQSGLVTATEVISRNSALFRSISKHSLLLEDSLIHLIEAINGLLNYIHNTSNEVKATVNFDDSIIEDRSVIEKRALLELNEGVIDLHEYLVITRGFTDEMAQEFIDNMEKRKRGVEEEVVEVNEDGTEGEGTKDMRE